MTGMGIGMGRVVGAVVMMAAEQGSMTPQEAGAYFKKLRTDRHLRLSDVVDATTVPSMPYLSSLEKGRYNVLRSEHFPSLARFYGLSEQEIRSMKPDAFIEVSAENITKPGVSHSDYVQVRIEMLISGIKAPMNSHNPIITNVPSRLVGMNVGGLVMDRSYIREISEGFYALWSDRVAEEGELVIIEKDGAQYPAFLMPDGLVEVDTAIDALTPQRFKPDRIIGVVEEVRMLEVPTRRNLS